MRQVGIVVVSLIAGFAGGLISPRLFQIAEESPRRLVRARSFELVDATGHTISVWGVDQLNNAVLAFGSRGLAAGKSHPPAVSTDLANVDNQLITIGLSMGDNPMLEMRGADGKRRIMLFLDPDAKPILSMGDENGPRVSLGIEHSDTHDPKDNDWTLVFWNEMARIGIMADKAGDHKYVRGVFNVNPNKTKMP
jgi:hypothetical protein